MAADFGDEEHQAAFLLDPLDEGGSGSVAGLAANATAPPSKRRKIAPGKAPCAGKVNGDAPAPAPRPAGGFVPLFGGAEKLEFVRRRDVLYRSGWARSRAAVRRVLRQANSATLDSVCDFVRDAVPSAAAAGQIPAAFIVTGPNVSSRDLLFAQLDERLQQRPVGADDDERVAGGHDVDVGVDSGDLQAGRRDMGAARGRFVRVSSGEASNLKAVLKKIIHDATWRGRQGGDAQDNAERDIAVTKSQTRRKYLDYDLEALHVFLRGQDAAGQRVFVTFEDSEAFDSGLLSDLITLLASWRDRIRFTLLFGIGTSVELFQGRLLRSAVQQIYGAQFDVVRADAVLARILHGCLARTDQALVLGSGLLSSLLERHSEQVTSVQMFISSLKYAYMCHFYTNPLSALLPLDDEDAWPSLQPEHIEAIRHLPSFRREVESSIEGGKVQHARSLLENDDYVAEQARQQQDVRRKWVARLVRSLQLISDSSAACHDFTALFVAAIADGIDIAAGSPAGVVDAIRKMAPDELANFIKSIICTGNSEGGEDNDGFAATLRVIHGELKTLQARAEQKGKALRSKYSTQGKVLRTTVVAQKVQLSRDTAALTEEDKAFTALLGRLTDALSAQTACRAADELFLCELWLYEGRSPHRDVFVPAPGATFKRALSRPHDYLGCVCCAGNCGISSTLPATSILYHLYLETGSLVNVADFWTAFSGLVVDDDTNSEEGEAAGDGRNMRDLRTGRCDERTALVLFYRGLAELRAMGFVQQTRKKEDHVAKVKWL